MLGCLASFESPFPTFLFLYYKFRLEVLKILCINDINIGTSYYNLISKFKEKFGDINYDFDLISELDKKDLISKYIKKNKLKKNDISIDEVINMKSQAIKAINYAYNINKLIKKKNSL